MNIPTLALPGDPAATRTDAPALHAIAADDPATGASAPAGGVAFEMLLADEVARLEPTGARRDADPTPQVHVVAEEAGHRAAQAAPALAPFPPAAVPGAEAPAHPERPRPDETAPAAGEGRVAHRLAQDAAVPDEPPANEHLANAARPVQHAADPSAQRPTVIASTSPAGQAAADMPIATAHTRPAVTREEPGPAVAQQGPADTAATERDRHEDARAGVDTARAPAQDDLNESLSIDTPATAAGAAVGVQTAQARPDRDSAGANDAAPTAAGLAAPMSAIAAAAPSVEPTATLPTKVERSVGYVSHTAADAGENAQAQAPGTRPGVAATPDGAAASNAAPALPSATGERGVQSADAAAPLAGGARADAGDPGAPAHQALTHPAPAAQPASANAAYASAGAAALRVDAPLGGQSWHGAFAERIVWLAGQGTQVAQLHLNPPDLGPVAVTLQLSADEASARFVSAHPAVREAIEAALPRLREMFAESGLTLGHTQVSAQASGQHAGEHYRAPAALRDAGGDAMHASGAGSERIASGRAGLIDTFA